MWRQLNFRHLSIQRSMIEAVNDYFRGEGDNPCDAAGVKVMEMIDRLSQGLVLILEARSHLFIPRSEHLSDPAFAESARL